MNYILHFNGSPEGIKDPVMNDENAKRENIAKLSDYTREQVAGLEAAGLLTGITTNVLGLLKCVILSGSADAIAALKQHVEERGIGSVMEDQEISVIY